MVTFEPGLLPGTISGPMVLPQPGAVLMSVACVATKGQRDARDLGHNCGHVGI